MKFNKEAIGLLLSATLIFFTSCKKEDTREFLPKPKPQTAKGFFDGLINGNPWPRYGNSSNRITVVDFEKGGGTIEVGYEECDSLSNLRRLGFATYYPSGNSDLGFSFFIKAEIGTVKKLYSRQFLDYQKVPSAIFCQQLPKFFSGIILEGADAPLANYYLDDDFDNTLTISAISDTTIEGSFHIKLLDENYLLGFKNPNGVPDSLELNCKKFKAVLTKKQ